MKTNQIMKVQLLFSLFCLSAVLISCGDDKQKDTVDKADVLIKSNKPRSKNDTTPHSVPIINLQDTVAYPYIVICFKDSARNNVRLSQKLADIYGKKLQAVIKKNKLTVVGAPMAWYKSQKAPFFFEAGLPVDKKPSKLPKGFYCKNTGGLKVMVAHYFGPYEETFQAYQVLKEWMADEKKVQAAPAYEIYVTDPVGKDGQLLDPYKVQTDIIFPYR